MSDYLIHLTGSDDVDGGHGRLSNILTSGLLEAGSDGVGTARRIFDSEVRRKQQAVSLSEIPLGWMHRLTRHGSCGIGFAKDFVRRIGGAPVWYLHADTPAADAFERMMRAATYDGINSDDQIWNLTLFIDNPRPGIYEFDWEREWRVPGQLTFDPGDVSFIFAPECSHGAWMQRLYELHIQVPVLDPSWSMARLQDALSEHGL